MEWLTREQFIEKYREQLEDEIIDTFAWFYGLGIMTNEPIEPVVVDLEDDELNIYAPGRSHAGETCNWLDCYRLAWLEPPGEEPE